ENEGSIRGQVFTPGDREAMVDAEPTADEGGRHQSQRVDQGVGSSRKPRWLRKHIHTPAFQAQSLFCERGGYPIPAARQARLSTLNRGPGEDGSDGSKAVRRR